MPRPISASKSASVSATAGEIRLDNPWVISLALVLAVFVAYGPLLTSSPGFMLFDDQTYVVKNPHVQGGLTATNIAWAFGASYAGNWHPLTWLSLQLDADLYGLNPTGFHVTNVVLHSASAVLLFLTLRRATQQIWPSAFVAGRFAVHPLHVESVAWVAERKDVLSTFFWLLTMLAYIWYAEKPSWRRYGAVGAAFALGLLAKQMLVTLPIILLLFDYWPLRRTSSWRFLVVEKLPLLALAVAAGLLTLRAQQVDQQILLANLPLRLRLLNSALADVGYLSKTFWPVDLAPMYTRPVAALPIGAGIASAAALLLLTALALRQARRRPAVFVGWSWFLIALAPVIGLVQVGIQTMADRYTYVPHIGLFVMLTWGPLDWLMRQWPQRGLAVGAAVLLVACLALTIQQSLLWQNEIITRPISSWVWRSKNASASMMPPPSLPRLLVSSRITARRGPNWRNAGFFKVKPRQRWNRCGRRQGFNPIPWQLISNWPRSCTIAVSTTRPPATPKKSCACNRIPWKGATC